MKDKTDVQIFTEDVARFWEACGQKTFWDKSFEERQKVIEGLSWAYVMLKPQSQEENEKMTRLFEGALDNYARREALILTMSLRTL